MTNFIVKNGEEFLGCKQRRSAKNIRGDPVCYQVIPIKNDGVKKKKSSVILH